MISEARTHHQDCLRYYSSLERDILSDICVHLQLATQCPTTLGDTGAPQLKSINMLEELRKRMAS